jgi:hypothetical protein
MSRWFRWHEGTCEDGKFRVVARNAGVTVATVMGVWAILLEDASHDDHRGIAVRGEDFYAAILDLGSELQPILEAMQNIGLIACCTNDTIEISNWSKRQYETDTTDSTNAERQRRFRDKHKSNGAQTKRNGSVTATKRPDTDTDTDTEAEKKEPREVALMSIDPNEFPVFWEAWPNKVGKHAAVKALASARKRGVPFETIMAGVHSYIRDKPPDRSWMNPATFLNGNRWEDQPARAGVFAKPATVHQQRQLESKEALDALRNASRRQDFGVQRHDPGNGQGGVHSGVRGAIIDLSAARDREGHEPVERSSGDGQLSELGKVSGAS